MDVYYVVHYTQVEQCRCLPHKLARETIWFHLTMTIMNTALTTAFSNLIHWLLYYLFVVSSQGGF